MTLPVDPIALTRALRERGYPPPVEVLPLGTPRALGSYGLRFGAGAPTPRLVLRVELASTGDDPLAHEHAALKIASTVLELPLPGGYSPLPAAALGRRAALCGYIEGQPGASLLGGEHAVAVLERIGWVLAALADVPQADFGTRATTEGGFSPRRATWREEVGARIWDHHRRALAGGTDLGPVSERLLMTAMSALPALDHSPRFGLVHGDLHPGNLMFHVTPRGLELRGLIDWEHSLVGDPLVDWALPLLMPAETLAAVIRGYGPDRAEALRQPEAIARLGVYATARCLHGLAHAALPIHETNEARPRALLLERARMRCQAALEPRWVEAQLERGFSSLAQPGWRGSPAPTPAATLSRRALGRLREAPEADAADLLRVAGALAAAERGAAGLGEARDLVRADLNLPPRPVHAAPIQGEPIPDRAGWRAALTDRALAGCGQETPTRTGSLVLLSLGFLTLDKIGNAASDAVLRGLETGLHTLLKREERTRGALSPPEALLHALIGLDAMARLAPYARIGFSVEPLQAQADDARLDLILSGSTETPALASSELGVLLPALLLALDANPEAAGPTLAALGIAPIKGR